MNPQNNALQRTYFIGGPPRVGKGILANRLAKQISGHVASTDAIRNSVKKALKFDDSDLFVVNRLNDLSDEQWLDKYIKNPEEVIKIQNAESRAIWPSIVGFCNSFCEDNENHILEGVAILPELVASMEYQPKNVVFIGNTNPNHAKAMINFSRSNPEWDWMKAMGYTDEKIFAMAKFVTEMSKHIRNEAEKHGYNYVEINDNNFSESMDKAITTFSNTDEKNTTITTDTMPKLSEVKLYTDGGSRGNPGPSASAYVIQDMDGNELESDGLFIGITTNNQAEYQALRRGLERLLQLNAKTVHVFMDSELVVKQMRGEYKVKNRDLWPIYESLVELSKKFKNVHFNHVPRELNKQADSEVNRILDESR